MQLLLLAGSQDEYITSNPQITFFKNTYRRHTNFSRDDNIIFDGKIDNCEKTFLINRDCDLLNGINLIIDLQENINYKNDVDSYIVESAEIYFDNTCIQKITNDFINITNKLLYKKSNTKKIANKLFINLPFWFTEVSNALPLIALKNKLTLKIKFNLFDNIKNLQVIANRIFLESEERIKFAKQENIYLFANNFIYDRNIDIHNDMQYMLSLKQPNNMIDIYFLFDKLDENQQNYFNYDDISSKTIIKLNNKELANFEKIYYTNYMQTSYEKECDNVYVYSFSLYPVISHYKSHGYCENLNADLHILNDFVKIKGKYKMKLLIRYYNLLSINSVFFTLENKFDEKYLNFCGKNNSVDVEFPDVIII